MKKIWIQPILSHSHNLSCIYPMMPNKLVIMLSYLEEYWRFIKGYDPQDLGASTLSFCYIYCLGFYPVSLGAVDLPSTL